MFTLYRYLQYPYLHKYLIHWKFSFRSILSLGLWPPVKWRHIITSEGPQAILQLLPITHFALYLTRLQWIKEPIGVKGRWECAQALEFLILCRTTLSFYGSFLVLRTDAITKCRVIQKIEKTLNNSTHTTTQKRIDRHNLREVNYNRGATHHLHISRNTPCLPPNPSPRPPRETEDNACTQFWGETDVYYVMRVMRDVQMGNRLTAVGNQRNARKTLTNVFHWNFGLTLEWCIQPGVQV